MAHRIGPASHEVAAASVSRQFAVGSWQMRSEHLRDLMIFCSRLDLRGNRAQVKMMREIDDLSYQPSTRIGETLRMLGS